MPRERLSLLLLFFLPICLNLRAHADGVWLKNEPPPDGLSAGLQILKAGVFGRGGTFTPQSKASPTPCPAALIPRRIAWVTHRLAAEETISAEAGEKLGSKLADYLPRHCFRGVELDVEPLPEPPAWLAPFLRGVKRKLGAGLFLSLAIPPVASSPLPGLSWRPAQALGILEAVDGLHLMIYDTGLVTPDAYEALLRETAKLVGDWRGKFPDKEILLDLPTYYDRTRKHRLDVENLRVVQRAWKDFPAELCLPRVDWAFYAGWTMTPDDVASAASLARQRRLCCSLSPR
jgi:hypothetical protein